MERTDDFLLSTSEHAFCIESGSVRCPAVQRCTIRTWVNHTVTPFANSNVSSKSATKQKQISSTIDFPPNDGR